MNDAFYNSLDDLLIHFMQLHRDSRHWLQLRKLSTLSWGPISAEWGGFCVGGKKPTYFPRCTENIDIMIWYLKNPMQKTTTKNASLYCYIRTQLAWNFFVARYQPTDGDLDFSLQIFTPSRKGFDESLSFTDSNLWLQQWKFLGFGTQRRTSRSALMVKTKTKKRGTFS